MKTSDFTDHLARFWSKVERNGDDCWLWVGEKHSHGYGVFAFWGPAGKRQRWLAHRLMLLIHGVELEDSEVVVRHACDNPPCVNPNHLLTGTQADNVRDAIERDRYDGSGLAIGQAVQWPPRPCRRCGTTVTEGRRRFCPSCRRIVTQESQQRYREKKRAIR